MQQEYAYTLKATEELGEGNVIKEYYYDMFSDQLLRVVKFTLNASGDYTESVEKFVYDAIVIPRRIAGALQRGETADVLQVSTDIRLLTRVKVGV